MANPDNEKMRDETLKRMLGTPPKPHVNASETNPNTKKKGDVEVVTRRRPDPKKFTSSES
jgi:hypothetical protein